MGKIDVSNWREFRLADIAMLHYGNKFDKNKMNHNNPKVNFVSRTSANNGISDVVDTIESVEPYPAGCVTLAFGGSIGSCFLQEEPFYTGQNVGVIEFASDVPKEAKLYFAVALEKVCKAKFVTFSDEINKHFKTDLSLFLPATEQNVPDWSYMQECIAELERERIAELERYLVASGLNDYTLTSEDNAILFELHQEMKEFKISDVFSLHKGQRLTKADQLPGDTPFIGSTESNNGVTGYIGQKPIFDGNAITISYNGSVGQVFYQEQPFWASDDINVLYLKDHILDRELFGYLGASLYRAGKAFSYTFKWNLERMRDTMFTLPIQTDNGGQPVIDNEHTYHPDGYIPDWDYMAKYIRAVEKLVIADVVKFKDETIVTTKAVV